MDGVTTLYTKQGRILPCFCYESLPSTNDEAKRIARTGEYARFSVAAEGQTAGRGRMSRAFLSPRGMGLYLSFVYEPTGAFTRTGVLAALAVGALLEEYFGIDARFKWPNDVIAEGKKICGILPESVVAADGARRVVIGAGVNLFEEERDFGELADIATSAVLCCKNERLKAKFMQNKRAVTLDMAVRLTELMSRLADCEESGEDLLPEYRAKLLTLGKRVRFTGRDGAPCVGVASDIAPDCSLIVLTGDGKTAVGWGEVTEQGGAGKRNAAARPEENA